MQCFNPYMPSWEYVPDGEPHVFEGRVYVYGSHDRFRGHAFCLGDYVCYSAPVEDLTNWRYEGVIYPKTTDPKNADGSMCLYAPDVCQGADGRYYLYYTLDHTHCVSVAVCDTPAGRYEFYGDVHYEDGTLLGDGPYEDPQFDPAVLFEDDQVYLYTGFCGKGDPTRHGPMVTVLDSDMLTIKENPKFIMKSAYYAKGEPYEGHEFFEGPSIRKFNGKYYFAYSSILMHELCYAISDKPTEGFEYKGTIVSNADIGIDTYKPADHPICFGGNNHGGMVQVGDDYYIFYHRQTNGTWFSRQGCAEKLTMLPDGTVPQVEITSGGLGGILPGKGKYPAYIACHLQGIEPRTYVNEMDWGMGPGFPRITQEGRDGDEIPGHIECLTDGTMCGFKYFDCQGVKRIKLECRGYTGGSVVEVLTKWDGEPIGEIPVAHTNEWHEEVADIAIPDGIQSLYFRYKGKHGYGTLSIKSFTLE